MSLDSELRIIGTISAHSAEADKVFDTLRQDDFSTYETKALFASILALNEESSTWTLVDVKEAITGQSEDTQDAFNASVEATVGPSTLEGDVKRVKQASIRAKLAALGRKLTDSDSNVQALLAEAEDVLESAACDTINKPIGKLKAELDDIVYRLEHREEVNKQFTSTPFNDLNAMTNGMKPGNLIILAARPSMGKTALGLNVTTHVLTNDKKPVLFFTLEMSKEELQDRLIYAQAQINGIQAERGSLTDSEWQRVARTMDVYSEGAEMYIEDKAALTPQEIRAKARRINRECGGLGLVVVDYIQIMGVDGRWGNREQEVAHASRSLKQLAMDLKCPVMALSQLNRSVNQRQDRRPGLSDLRESGAIEQDADHVWLLYREDYYRPLDQEDDGMAELIIAKQRNGPTGTVQLRFVEECARFENV